jgi:hypothetical protein
MSSDKPDCVNHEDGQVSKAGERTVVLPGRDPNTLDSVRVAGSCHAKLRETRTSRYAGLYVMGHLIHV